MIAHLWQRFAQKIDGFLFAVALSILALATVVLFSATDQDPQRLLSHAFNVAAAVAVMWLIANMPQRTLMNFGPPLYLLGVLLLLAVAINGQVVNGARRWLSLGFTRIQPSELMKVALPLAMAWYFERNEATLRIRDFLVAGLLVLVPAALIVRQPDLGTAILVAGAGFFVLYLAGLSWRIIAAMAAIDIGGIYWVSHYDLCVKIFHDYQCERVATMLDPSQDPLGAGYHIIQATIAIGSGGVFGKGWLNGTQTHLDFLPERHTDFIFAVFGEEFGLIGNLVLIALYLLLIGRGLSIAATASTLFGRLMAGTVSLMFFTYAIVNMGMVSGILPVVGVPLPLVSYGGTALVTLFCGLGILMNVHSNRTLLKQS